MTKEKQLIKNTGILAFGKICTQFVSFFLLPLYTALLSTKEYGIVDILNTYITLLLPIVFFQIEQAVFRFLIDVRKDEKSKVSIISTSFFTVLIQSIIFISIYFFISLFINNKYKYFLVINVIASMFSSLFLQFCRGLGDNVTYSLGSLVAGISTIILNVLFIAVFNFGAYGMLLASFIANILCFIFIIIKNRFYNYIKISAYSKKLRKELWKYSVPLIPNQLSWWIVNVSDRTIIATVLGVAANGIYSAANKFSSICNTVFNIFNLTWSESASMHIKDGDSSEFFSKVVNTTLKLFTSVCFIIIAVMPFCFKFLITGSDFKDAYYQIPVLMIGTIFSILVSLFGSIYVALKKSNEIAKTSIYAAVINISINLLLVNKIGLFASSFSTLIAYFVMAIYRYFDVQKYVKIYLDFKIILLSVFFGFIVIIIYYLNNSFLNLIGFVLIILYSFISNKDIIKNVTGFLLKKIKKL